MTQIKESIEEERQKWEQEHERAKATALAEQHAMEEKVIPHQIFRGTMHSGFCIHAHAYVYDVQNMVTGIVRVFVEMRREYFAKIEADKARIRKEVE
eukprot:1359986-Amorphochlora_amoeboformis.AAC.1